MRLGDLLDIMRAIAGRRERSELMSVLVETLHEKIRTDWIMLCVLRGRDSRLFDYVAHPPIALQSERLDDFRSADLLSGGGGAHVIHEQMLAEFPKHQEMWRTANMRSALRIPLTVEGAVVGVLSLLSRDPAAFDAFDREIFNELGTVVSVAVDSCLAYEHLARLRDEADESNTELREALASVRPIGDDVIGHGAAFAAVKRQVEMVATTDATVLITGESGTGKDVVARAIHSAGNRRDRPLVTVNCAAIPSALAESELFGHEEGAFTGASRARIGRFEQAHGGTLFLDEVGELPLEVQAKLLRVIQERELERVGGGEPIPIDVRIIAATNRDLQEMIHADRFREDLYFRLAVFPIHLPPLRSRLDDLPGLVDYFVKLAAERFHVAPRRVTPEVIRRLSDHDWPGNVRELQHAIERAMIVSPGDLLAVDAVVPRRIAPISTGDASDSLRSEYLDALERAGWIIEGNAGAATRLGLHPNTLRHRLKRMGIVRPRAPSSAS